MEKPGAMPGFFVGTIACAKKKKREGARFFKSGGKYSREIVHKASERPQSNASLVKHQMNCL
jgi:hypothetical protein